MGPNLERVDQQLINIQIELKKLQVIVDSLCGEPPEGQRGLKQTIQHHRADLLDSSRAITQKIERICLAGD